VNDPYGDLGVLYRSVFRGVAPQNTPPLKKISSFCLGVSPKMQKKIQNPSLEKFLNTPLVAPVLNHSEI